MNSFTRVEPLHFNNLAQVGELVNKIPLSLSIISEKEPTDNSGVYRGAVFIRQFTSPTIGGADGPRAT